MPQRILSEVEFNAIKDRVLAQAPDGLDEDSFTRWAGPRMAAAVGEAESLPAPTEGGAVGRFLSNAGEMLNPVTLVTGIARAVRHPIDTATNLARAQYEQGAKAVDLAKQGRFVEATGHAAAAALPLIGPAAAEAGEQIASGDIAGGLGKGVGLLVPTLAPEAIRLAKVGTTQGARAAAAGALESKAGEMVASVISPKIGPNKVRFGNQAQKLAPQLVERGEAGAWSRQGLHATVQERLATAEGVLDEAAEARNPGLAYPTRPLIDALKVQRQKLVSEAVEGDRLVPSLEGSGGRPLQSGLVRDVETGRIKSPLSKEGRPIGENVVPSPNAARVAVIDQAIGELKQLGSVARYESLRRIRQAYDGPAKAVYSPAVTADFLKAQGGKLGAADVTGTLREGLAKMDPGTAAANAQYSLYRGLDDVLQAAKETESVRPRIGRHMASVLFGTSAAGAPGGALALAADLATAAGWTPKLKAAQMMGKLAKAIRAGDVGRVTSLSYQLKQLARQGAVQAGRLTSPSESQSSTAPVR